MLDDPIAIVDRIADRAAGSDVVVVETSSQRVEARRQRRGTNIVTTFMLNGRRTSRENVVRMFNVDVGARNEAVAILSGVYRG